MGINGPAKKTAMMATEWPPMHALMIAMTPLVAMEFAAMI
jgi:hypothetical protein